MSQASKRPNSPIIKDYRYLYKISTIHSQLANFLGKQENKQLVVYFWKFILFK
jgi:hypothetical protein